MRESLATAALYEREIHALAERRASRHWHAQPHLSAPLLALHAPDVARRLAAEVSSGSYALQTLLPHAAHLNGKPRTIYHIDPLDAVVLGVFTRVVMAAIEPQLGDHLHSYRKGCSQWTACQAFARYLQAHQRSTRDPRERGVFVLRRDVRRYDENIPTGDDSQLWSTLSRLLGTDDLGLRGDLSAFLRRAFRPSVLHADQSCAPLARGVPTGLPTQTIACNTYLLPLDAELLAIPGAFYARFGDDILFAHPDAKQAEQVAQCLEESIRKLDLTFNPAKSRAFWLTRPGRAHPSAMAFIPTAHFPYLGFDVGFDGARLRSDKRRELWLSLRARVLHTDRLLQDAPLPERAAALCAVVRTAFDPHSLLSDRYAPWLRFAVMSVEDLRQLDHHIALLVAERLTRQRGVRAFRTFPPRRLYTDYQLPSLQQAFVQARRRRGAAP